MSNPVDSIVGVIPLIGIGYVAARFADMIPEPKAKKRKATKKTGFGNFSNVGF